MLVRLVVEYRRGDLRVPAGGLLEVEDDEAIRLVEDGQAVPAPRDLRAAEYR